MGTDKLPPPLIFSAELAQLIPYTQNHLRRLEAEGKFPKRVRVGENRVAWVRADIDRWIAARIDHSTWEGAQ